MKELALIFGRLGLLGFGGPIAVMAMMEEETSRKRGWFPRERFIEIYAVCKLLPGPVATQMAIYIGYLRAGVLGGIVSGLVFIFPAFLIVLILSALYVRTQSTQDPLLFSGLQAGALGVIAVSLIQFAKPYYKEASAWGIAAVSAIAIYLHPSWEPVVILAWGLLGAAIATGGFRSRAREGVSVLASLFWVCFKAGAFVFGTGLAIVPLLEGDVVAKHGWLTRSEFMDGLAIGQITPGPVVITATFIGYKTAGLVGALVATAGMFLPPFFNVLVLVPRVWERFSGTPGARGFTRYAIPAVIGGIAGAVVKLSVATFTSFWPVAMPAASVAVLLTLRWPAWLVILLAGASGIIPRLLT